MSDPSALSENLDAVLRKYGKIWIWSILSAAVAALSLRFFAAANIVTLPNFANYAGGARSSPWSPLLMLSMILPSLGTLAATWFLLQFLRHHIVPILFPPAPVAPVTESADYTLTGAPAGVTETAAIAQVPDGGQLLYRAFAAMVFALALEVAEALVSILLRVLAN